MYVCLLLNHLSCPSLNGDTPLGALTGQPPDVSALLQYHFYEPVYFYDQETAFPSKTGERLGYWVGIHESCGDPLTYKILTADTQKVIPRSLVRSAAQDHDRNVHLETAGGEDLDTKPIVFIQDGRSNPDDPAAFKPMKGFDPDDLIGRTYLKPPNEDGETLRARILRKIVDCTDEATNARIKYLVGIQGAKS